MTLRRSSPALPQIRNTTLSSLSPLLIEWYEIHVPGSPTFLTIIYDPSHRLDPEARKAALDQAAIRMIFQLQAHGNIPLVPSDDPYQYELSSVLIRVQSVEPYKLTYQAAANTIRGLYNFFDDLSKKGTVKVLIRDASISGQEELHVWVGMVLLTQAEVSSRGRFET